MKSKTTIGKSVAIALLTIVPALSHASVECFADKNVADHATAKFTGDAWDDRSLPAAVRRAVLQLPVLLANGNWVTCTAPTHGELDDTPYRSTVPKKSVKRDEAGRETCFQAAWTRFVTYANLNSFAHQAAAAASAATHVPADQYGWPAFALAFHHLRWDGATVSTSFCLRDQRAGQQ